MIQNMMSQVSVERIGQHVQALEGVRHPIAAPEALERAAEYIRTTLARLGYQVESHPFAAQGREFRNLVASRRGTRRPEERLLIIAHYDTVENSPGADDNASGVAVLLELAQLLAPVTFERTVQFVAVNLEERQVAEGPLDTAGLFGSRALAAKAREEGWQIVGVIVFDAIAYAGAEIAQKTPNGLPVALPEAGDFLAVVGNEASKELVAAFKQAVGRYEVSLPIVPLLVPGKGEMLRDARRSDHAPFWDQDYPAVMLTDTANYRSPHYHQPTDTLDTCNLAFTADVCRAVMGVVVDVAGVLDQGDGKTAAECRPGRRA